MGSSLKFMLLFGALGAVFAVLPKHVVGQQGGSSQCGYCDYPPSSVCIEGEHEVDEDGNGLLREGYHADCRVTVWSCEEWHSECNPAEDVQALKEMVASVKVGDWFAVRTAGETARAHLQFKRESGQVLVTDCHGAVIAQAYLGAELVQRVESLLADPT